METHYPNCCICLNSFDFRIFNLAYFRILPETYCMFRVVGAFNYMLKCFNLNINIMLLILLFWELMKPKRVEMDYRVHS